VTTYSEDVPSVGPARPPLASAAGDLPAAVALAALADVAAVTATATTLDAAAARLLQATTALPGVRRSGLALVRAAGRELSFAASDDDAVGSRDVRWCTVDSLARLPVPDAVASGRIVHLPDVMAMTMAYPGFAERQVSLGAHAVTALPLHADGERIGALLLSWSDPHPLDGVGRAFLEALATTAGAALARAAAVEGRERRARAWQRGLLPPALPDVDGLAFGAAWQPAAEVGGDWYDAFALDDGRAVLAVGDVVGRGTPAAAVMADVRAALRAYALVDPHPARVLARLHRFVESSGDAERLATLALVVVDAQRSAADVALAGHPPPVLVDAAGGVRVPLVPPGPPLGVADGPWPVVRVDLPPAVVLALCSDGLVESPAVPAADGIRRLGDVLAGLGAATAEPRALALRAASALSAELHGDRAVGDDRTLLLAASTRGRSVRRCTLSVEPTLEAPAQARAAVAGAFAAWGVPAEAGHEAQVCVSELVTNAVVHARSTVDVTLQLEGSRVLVLVADGALEGAAELRDGDPESAGGRGLLLVDALSEAWGVESTAQGTTVWCELLLPTG
jgi:serine phosphatase RsbU (regulator of sigma subunit)/anti-sigma regulatory factor (Ser/Thr protein kinase)